MKQIVGQKDSLQKMGSKCLTNENPAVPAREVILQKVWSDEDSPDSYLYHLTQAA